jgi:uncharacterized protein YbjT (DUF2867 family)
MTTVVVFGGSGFFGRQLVQRLAGTDWLSASRSAILPRRAAC